MITVEQIDEKPIAEIKLDFATLMSGIVIAYGDDQGTKKQTTDQQEEEVTVNAQ